ncbi:nuclear transcription factor Y subunit B-1 [Daucus carota subsp. sativus]|uniref:nuclear transcription factor Y subunit B-1 n=1 Tax=Daucus carota subsp. sativus TaxID=79200 RepID=UPI0030829A6F
MPLLKFWRGMESIVENAAVSPGRGSSENGNRSFESVRDQDMLLPIANISRIMRKAVPQNGKIAKESKERIQECVTDFISYITGEASDKCREDKRKTISGDDVLWAMSRAGFQNYIGPLTLYMHKFRAGEKRAATKGGRGSANMNGGVGGSGIGNGDNGLAQQISHSQVVIDANSQILFPSQGVNDANSQGLFPSHGVNDVNSQAHGEFVTAFMQGRQE